MLVRVIADNAFKNYSTMKELLKIKPLKDKMYHLQQNKSVLEKFFFSVIFTEKMKKIDTFSKCLKKLRVCTEYLWPFIIHNFKTENLYLISMFSLFLWLTWFFELIWGTDKLYLTAQKIKHSEHKDEQTYCDFCMFNNAETDLQEGYFDEKICNIMNDCFYRLTLHHNLKLWQALLVKKQYELKNALKFVIIEKKIDALTLTTKTDSAARNCQKALIAEKQKLISEELCRCQKL